MHAQVSRGMLMYLRYAVDECTRRIQSLGVLIINSNGRRVINVTKIGENQFRNYG
jgi:hypothetical protein